MTEAKITILEKGPYRVSSGLPLADSQGNPVSTRDGKTYNLCRCGRSASKPFCDANHRSVGYTDIDGREG